MCYLDCHSFAGVRRTKTQIQITKVPTFISILDVSSIIMLIYCVNYSYNQRKKYKNKTIAAETNIFLLGLIFPHEF